LCNGEKTGKVIQNLQADQHQKLITSRGSPLSHADHVWSTSVCVFVSYPAHSTTDRQTDKQTERSHNLHLGRGNNTQSSQHNLRDFSHIDRNNNGVWVVSWTDWHFEPILHTSHFIYSLTSQRITATLLACS